MNQNKSKLRKFLYLILIISISSCNSDIKLSKEYKELELKNTELKTELNDLKKTIDSLNNTPEQLKRILVSDKLISIINN